jgi:hypothetical protein
LINAFGENYFRYMVFEDPSWDVLSGNADTAEKMAEKMAEEKTGRALNAIDPDLRRFRARGGKLILYHGWNDPAIPAVNTINYYNSVVAEMGASSAQNVIRLYMVPGMQHCFGGPGPSVLGQFGTKAGKGPEHGIYSALEDWVEKATAPTAIIATKYLEDNPGKGVQMTRPVCTYPQIAKYKGTGDTNDSSSFVCTAEAAVSSTVSATGRNR